MPDQPAVYSCPSCGALSKVDPSSGDGSVCVECGYEFKRPVQVAPRQAAVGGVRRFVQRDVVSRRRQVVHEKAVLPPERDVPKEIDTIEEESSERTDDEVVSDDGHKKVIRRRKKRRKQTSARPYILSVIWILAVVVVFLVLKDRTSPSGDPANAPETEAEAARRVQAAKMRAYISGHIGECRQVLEQFWLETKVEGKAQFVYSPMRVTPSMYRYSQQHGFHKPKGKVHVLGRNLVLAGDRRMIETVWEDEEENRFEVVFVRDEGAWKIDWESYVRYSSTRWDVFVSGAIRSEGDFRLYVREVPLSRLDGGQHIGLKFYPPSYQVKSRRKGESETVLVRADSELGRKVRVVLDGVGDEVEPGEAAARGTDPKGMARVRVLLEWRGDEGVEPSLYLNELVAESWFAEELVDPIPVGGDDAGAGETDGTSDDAGAGETDGTGDDAGAGETDEARDDA